MSLWNRIRDYLRSYGFSAVPLLLKRHKAHKKAMEELPVFLPKLEEELLPVLEKEEGKFVPTSAKRIFFFWWEGLEKAPKIVKMNARRLEDLYGKDYEILFLNKDSYRSFANVPKSLQDLFDQGKITIQTYSDILRGILIFQNGGIWMDSTVYLPKRIEFDDFLRKYGFYTLTTEKNKAFLSYKGQDCLWSTFLIGGSKGSPLFSKFIDLYQEYLSKHNENKPPYFLTDMFLMLSAVHKSQNEVLKRFGMENVQKGDFDILSNHLGDKDYKKCFLEIGSTPQKLNWRIGVQKFHKGSTIGHLYHQIMEKE